MHRTDLSSWQHRHDFAENNILGEKRTFWVFLLTLVTMIAEILAGTFYGSMALLADGWHMGTHAAAFLITLFAYRYARKHADNPVFSFGTGKVSVLGGFSSAIALGIVALIMLVESTHRLFSPAQIHFNEAILVAVIGLIVNVVCAFLLHDADHPHGHTHSHHHHLEHGHGHGHGHGHEDHNLRAAYFHVLADALTSVLAIIALVLGKYLGLNWLDSVMGIVGALIISRWAFGLIKQTSPILLDNSIDPHYQQRMIDTLEAADDNQVCDLHIWKVSADHYAAVISLVTQHPKPAQEYKQLLTEFDKISHLTIEVNQFREPH